MTHNIKNRHIGLIMMAVVLLPLALSSCEDEEKSTPSSVAKLVKMSFVENDSIPALGDAVFTIEQGVDTGLVYNKDSLAFGTDIHCVKPRLVFEETPGSAILQTLDTTISLSGNDSIDMSKTPIYLTVISEDGSTQKCYEIQLRVHQIDPDQWVWEKMCDNIWPEEDCYERALWVNNQFVIITNNGFSNHVYTSLDARNWNDLGEPTVLPSNCRVRQIISDNATLYYAAETTIYTSTDGKSWSQIDISKRSYTIQTMLMYWNHQVWAIVKQNGKQAFATLTGTEMTVSTIEVNGELPVSDFAAVGFENLSQRARALIIGGYSENGESMNTRWNLEYSPSIKDNGGYRLTEYSIDRPRFSALTGIEVVWYGKQLLLFGGVNKDMQYLGREILRSQDEGLNWAKVDSAKIGLPEEYQARQKQSVIVRGTYIYLFGGNDPTHAYSDVWRGQWNRLTMKDY